MVLHDINQSLCYSDEIVAMQDGRIRAQGLPEQIITPELCAASMTWSSRSAR